MPAEMPSEINPTIEPYLRLFAQRSQMPQVYGMVYGTAEDEDVMRLLLLEHAAIDLNAGLMPELTQAWGKASAMRQLNWLWQIAKLWQPMKQEKVSTTLLTPHLLRVDGGMLRILELESDQAPATLADLGKLWSQWRPCAALKEFLPSLCTSLIQEQIQAPDQLVAVLQQALTAQSPTQERRIQIATASDQGPSRQSNEDSCYPMAGQASNPTHPLVIVCDGIGGHEGGEVASGLAIETILQQSIDDVPPATLPYTLEDAVLAANTVISERNDQEQRQERQRMGTTVVMGYVRDYALYISHVGDSRAYRITRSGCSQVTLDDDVASREVRLGYTLYRDALQHPASGSLVQALGMGNSSYLHPTVQEFVLDEDCVYLFCSDGLSDNDRIEEYWQTDIAPILSSKLDLPTAARKLVEIANTKNGHDNVTVGLIYCKVSDRKGTPTIMPSTLLQSPAPTQITVPPTQEPRPAPSTILTQLTGRQNWKMTLLPLVAALGVVGVFALWVIPETIRNLGAQTTTPQPTNPPQPASPPITSPEVPPVSGSSFPAGTVVQIRQSNSGSIFLLRDKEVTNQDKNLLGQLPPGTVLLVQKVEGVPSNPGKSEDKPDNWLEFRVCSIPKPLNVKGVAEQNKVGWQREAAIGERLRRADDLKSECSPSGSPP
jgi:serine/threonine protein phosphatase PrpC